MFSCLRIFKNIENLLVPAENAASSFFSPFFFAASLGESFCFSSAYFWYSTSSGPGMSLEFKSDLLESISVFMLKGRGQLTSCTNGLVIGRAALSMGPG